MIVNEATARNLLAVPDLVIKTESHAQILEIALPADEVDLGIANLAEKATALVPATERGVKEIEAETEEDAVRHDLPRPHAFVLVQRKDQERDQSLLFVLEKRSPLALKIGTLGPFSACN